MSTPALFGVVHVHSTYSHDGLDSLAALRDFALSRNLGFVGLTDHAEDLDRDTFQRYLEECADLSDQSMQLIAGLEFRFAGFPGLHLLALGLREWITPATPAEFVAASRESARFTIVAHPVLAGYRLPDAVAEGIDAIEVWNASYNTRYLPDPRAIDLLHRLRRTRSEVVGVAGLDQHDRRNDRGTRVVLERPAAPEPLLELREGRFYNRGRTIRFDAAVGFGAASLGLLRVARGLVDAADLVHDRVVRWSRGQKR